LDELRDLLAVTENCVNQALLARQQSARFSEHHRIQAEEFKRQAARARLPETRASLLRIAASHERLAQFGAIPQASQLSATHGMDLSLVERQGYTGVERTKEDSMKRGLIGGSLEQARRHVAEGEDRVAKQEALVARLLEDGRHDALAAEARKVLETLKQTLALARDHLAIELTSTARTPKLGRTYGC
jgi:hypothetical protein